MRGELYSQLSPSDRKSLVGFIRTYFEKIYPHVDESTLAFADAGKLLAMLRCKPNCNYCDGILDHWGLIKMVDWLETKVERKVFT